MVSVLAKGFWVSVSGYIEVVVCRCLNMLESLFCGKLFWNRWV